MEKRQYKRINAGYKARITSAGETYEAVIEDLSESGICIVVYLLETPVAFVPDGVVDLEFESPSGDVINMKCKIKWSGKIPQHGVRNRLGLQIIDPQWDKIAAFL